MKVGACVRIHFVANGLLTGASQPPCLLSQVRVLASCKGSLLSWSQFSTPMKHPSSNQFSHWAHTPTRTHNRQICPNFYHEFFFTPFLSKNLFSNHPVCQPLGPCSHSLSHTLIHSFGSSPTNSHSNVHACV